MKVVGYLFRWTVGFFFFFLLAVYILVGLNFYKPEQLLKIGQFLCRALIRGIGIRVKVTGLDLFDTRKSYIIMCNHESLLDAFLFPGYIPLFFVAIEAAEHFSWFIWGRLTRRWGNIPIIRENLSEAIKSLSIAEERLREGTSIIIFPEGGRTMTGKLKEFKKGPFHLAKNAKADILPVVINGLYHSKPIGEWRVRPSNVTMNFGKPVQYSEYRDMSVEKLRDYIRDITQNLKFNTSIA